MSQRNYTKPKLKGERKKDIRCLKRRVANKEKTPNNNVNTTGTNTNKSTKNTVNGKKMIKNERKKKLKIVKY